MVRRRSTVRFRKRAPTHEDFSNLEPGTSFWRVAFEWQRHDGAGACDQVLLLPESGSVLGRGPGIGLAPGRAMAPRLSWARRVMKILALYRRAVTDRQIGGPHYDVLRCMPWRQIVQFGVRMCGWVRRRVRRPVGCFGTPPGPVSDMPCSRCRVTGSSASARWPVPFCRSSSSWRLVSQSRRLFRQAVRPVAAGLASSPGPG